MHSANAGLHGGGGLRYHGQISVVSCRLVDHADRISGAQLLPVPRRQPRRTFQPDPFTDHNILFFPDSPQGTGSCGLPFSNAGHGHQRPVNGRRYFRMSAQNLRTAPTAHLFRLLHHQLQPALFRLLRQKNRQHHSHRLRPCRGHIVERHRNGIGTDPLRRSRDRRRGKHSLISFAKR